MINAPFDYFDLVGMRRQQDVLDCVKTGLDGCCHDRNDDCGTAGAEVYRTNIQARKLRGRRGHRSSRSGELKISSTLHNVDYRRYSEVAVTVVLLRNLWHGVRLCLRLRSQLE